MEKLIFIFSIILGSIGSQGGHRHAQRAPELAAGSQNRIGCLSGAVCDSRQWLKPLSPP